MLLMFLLQLILQLPNLHLQPSHGLGKARDLHNHLTSISNMLIKFILLLCIFRACFRPSPPDTVGIWSDT